jgi:hypothetical protein
MDDCFKTATQCSRDATRMTAAERQFERFIAAIRRFECDDAAGRFEEVLARLVAARTGSTRRTASGVYDASARNLRLNNRPVLRSSDAADANMDKSERRTRLQIFTA